MFGLDYLSYPLTSSFVFAAHKTSAARERGGGRSCFLGRWLAAEMYTYARASGMSVMPAYLCISLYACGDSGTGGR